LGSFFAIARKMSFTFRAVYRKRITGNKKKSFPMIKIIFVFLRVVGLTMAKSLRDICRGSVADPGSSAFLTPGSGMEIKPGSGMNIPDHFSGIRNNF
jgi:hypothetical protein